jgi:hypothetical protein
MASLRSSSESVSNSRESNATLAKEREYVTEKNRRINLIVDQIDFADEIKNSLCKGTRMILN